MAFTPAPSRRSDRTSLRPRFDLRSALMHHRKLRRTKAAPIAFAVALVAFAFPFSPLQAQNASAHIAAITPNTGKSDVSVTITGKNLGKNEVTAVFLSDAKLDHKAVVVDQEATKIVIKVPALKPGDYNISVEESGAIYILPVIFKVTT